MAIDIQDAKRIVKRILLSNLIVDKSIYLTPLLSGPHGIGKSTVIHEIAKELHGVAITVDGGQLKEGEITGLPYQYSDKDGNVSFRFLPHYSVKRIQEREKRIYLKSHPDINYFIFGHRHIELDLLLSREARIVILGEWITLFTYAVWDGEHLFVDNFIEGETRL